MIIIIFAFAQFFCRYFLHSEKAEYRIRFHTSFLKWGTMISINSTSAQRNFAFFLAKYLRIKQTDFYPIYRFRDKRTFSSSNCFFFIIYR